MKLTAIIEILEAVGAASEFESVFPFEVTFPGALAECSENTKTILDAAKPLFEEIPEDVREQDLGNDELKATCDEVRSIYL